MSFINDWSKKAQVAASFVTEKTKDVAEQAKTNVSILAEQREIEKNYRAIGEWFIAEYEGEIPDALRTIVDAIHTSKAKIVELEARKEEDTVTAEVVEETVCPNCGSKSVGKFCADCGASIDQPAKEDAPAVAGAVTESTGE